MSVIAVSLINAEYLDSIFWGEKAHILAFAVLSFLGLWVYPNRPYHVLSGLLVLGAGIELAQAATSWRTADHGDLVMDIVGLMFGGLVFHFSLRQRRSHD